jgi:ribosomal peptide maturation radical SAM protein 1
MNNTNKVCLVSMPLAPIQRPSPALGLLAAVLRQEGIAVDVLYPNLWFVEFFGYEFYRLLLKTRPEDAVVEWFFADAAFEGASGDIRPLLERDPHRLHRYEPEERDALLDGLDKHRPRAPAFVAWVAREVLRREPSIVGCTSLFQQHVASLALLRQIRTTDDTVVTMMGGANCETLMGRTTHESFPWVDYVVSGEADGFLADLCRLFFRRGREVDPVLLPRGVFGPRHRDIGYPVASDFYDGSPRAISSSLEDLPPPDYDDYFEELRGNLLGYRIRPGLPFEASRGCWWGERKQCTFCGLNGEGMTYRSKPPEKLIDELKHLVQRYGTARLEGVDNILEMKYFDTLLPRLEAMDEPYSIFFETKANLKRRQIEQLARAGVRWIQPGLESLHSGVLKLMDKGVSAWQNLQTLKHCRQNGVRVYWNLISFFPGEKDEWYLEMAELIPLLAHLQPSSMVALRYDRYSPYHANPAKYGLSLEPNESYREVYPLDDSKIADLVYFFREAGDSDHLEKLLASPVPGRPGVQATRRAVEDWSDSWIDGGSELSGRDIDGVLDITDSRPCAVRSTHQFSGLAREVLALSDEAPPVERLYSTLAERVAPSTLDDIVAELKEHKLVVEVDRRLVGLVLHEPVAPLVPRHVPFGMLLPLAK